MPHIATRSITAALLLTLSTTALALPASSDTTSEHQAELSTTMHAINAAVEATKTDAKALCFVVVLPDNYTQARQIRDQWVAAKPSFDYNKHQVFFVTAQDAEHILDTSYLSRTHQSSATIAYRHGRPYHSRTGTLSTETLNNFIALSFNNSAPLTSAPSQTEFLYDSMNELTLAGQQAPAAKGACQLMLNLHALIQGPYASTYSDSDLADMTTLYNQTQLTLATLNLQDPAVQNHINSTRATAMRTWNKRTTSTFGFGIWSDLAMITGDTDSILAWIDQGLIDPFKSKRVTKTLADYGQPLAQLLIDNHRYQALACTITSPQQISDQLATTSQLAEQIANLESNSSPSYNNLITAATNQAAASHAALLFAGRDREAWQVAQLTQDFAAPQAASEALCTAAIITGTLSERHLALVANLNPTRNASILNSMNTTFAIVPTDD